MDNTPVKFSISRPVSCLVCGAPTNYCYYDVPSCAACKGYCRQCRFDQCVRVGMNPAAMKLPKSRNASFQFLESRKRVLESTDNSNLPSILPVKMSSITLAQPMEYRDVDFLLLLELKVRKLRESSYHSQDWYTSRLKDLIANQNVLGNCNRYIDNVTSSVKWNAYPTLKTIDNSNKEVRLRWFMVDYILSISMAKLLPVYQRLNSNDKESFITNSLVSVAQLTKIYYSHENHPKRNYKTGNGRLRPVSSTD
uniref:Nuclear receptor domain-containing protein n=1 Tax=Panagrellus redivivus TaxID=6233 RepID=A0A7E4UNQ0_PANRE